MGFPFLEDNTLLMKELFAAWKFFELGREIGYESVNLDLVYGSIKYWTTMVAWDTLYAKNFATKENITTNTITYISSVINVAKPLV